MDSIDLRSLLTAGRSLHERVEEALAHRVFSTVTVDKLLSLAGLGPDKPLVSLADLVDWFYSYFEFTKVWSRRVVAEAISNTVSAGRAGYAVGVVRSGDHTEIREPRLIRIGVVLPSDEIDLSADAVLLDANYVQRLLEELRTPEGTNPTIEVTPYHTVPDVVGKPSAGDKSRDTPLPPSGEGGRTSTDAVGHLGLTATVGKSGFFDLNRALSWLRDNAEDVQVTVSISASGRDGGFDRVRLRNGVIEPLEEGAANVEVNLE